MCNISSHECLIKESLLIATSRAQDRSPLTIVLFTQSLPGKDRQPRGMRIRQYGLSFLHQKIPSSEPTSYLTRGYVTCVFIMPGH